MVTERPNLSRAPWIAPSLLAADFGHLAEEVRAVEAAGADCIHLDVMDGRFVPNITIGPLIVRATRRETRLPIDVHLMIVEPERYVAEFRDAGADWISVHVEASPHLHRTVQNLRALGVRAGVVLNPHTPEESVRYLFDDLDLILVMSVDPGFGGQAFIPEVLPKLRALRNMIDETEREITLEVDGGVSAATAGAVARAGARVLVAGSAVFGVVKPGEPIAFDERVSRYATAIGFIREKAAEAEVVTPKCTVRLRRAISLGLSGAALGVAACLARAPEPPRNMGLADPFVPEVSGAREAPSHALDGEAAARGRLSAMLGVMQAARRLPVRNDVNSKVLVRGDMVDRLRAHIGRELPSEAVESEGELLAALEVVPADYDHAGTLYELLGAKIAGFYEPETKTMFLADDLDDDEADQTLAHELVHALQNQSFSLGSLRLTRQATATASRQYMR